MTHDPMPDLDLYVQAALGRKAEGIVVMDVRGLTSIADVFIICSGRSHRQVGAIADFIERFLRKRKIRPISVDGKKEGHWVLMDYGDVIIHVFYEETRRFYDLEGLWIDAQKISTPSLKAHYKTAGACFDGEEIYVE